MYAFRFDASPGAAEPRHVFGVCAAVAPIACGSDSEPPAGPGAGGTSSGGSAGAQSGSGGRGGSAGSGATGGSNPSGGSAGSNPSGGTAGSNPSDGSVGSSGSGGTAGGSGSAGTDGGVPPGSDLPQPPGGGVPRPSGTPGNLTVLDWAGFKGAASYSFDDAQPSHIEHYAALQAAGVPLTFYLNSSATSASGYDSTWTRAANDGHELGNHTVHHCRPDLTRLQRHAARAAGSRDRRVLELHQRSLRSDLLDDGVAVR